MAAAKTPAADEPTLDVDAPVDQAPPAEPESPPADDVVAETPDAEVVDGGEDPVPEAYWDKEITEPMAEDALTLEEFFDPTKREPSFLEATEPLLGDALVERNQAIAAEVSPPSIS